MGASSSPTLKNGVQALRPSTSQTITTSGTSAAVSNAFGGSIVRVRPTEDCYVVFATTPTATSSHMFLPADETEYFRCVPGEKMAAIQVTTGGTVYVTEMD